MELNEIVRRIVGETQPVGIFSLDHKAQENLKNLTDLIDSLIADVDNVARCAGTGEHSVETAAKYAKDYLHSIGFYTD